ncbi:MAG: FkbM family methyltransferase [Phycisphaerae bacterium]|nr:FkbM family methyltransferase [Phycisphaerae bacterium]MDD5381701.1 FkbM family methyltransferase [Phycisphaerae bacterium]
MNIENIKTLLPFIKKRQFGKAFSLAFNQIDHHINIKVLKKREVVRKVNNYPMILNFEEKGLSRDLIIHREREIAETETIKKIVKPGMCILEIGANVGYYTILMGKLAGKTGKIYSYEPYPHSVDILTRNVKLNNLTDIVEIHNMAISCDNTVKRLFLGNATNVHSLINYKTGDNNPDYVEVKTKDIREILVSADRKIDLLRMDIEGHEREIFNRLSSDIKAFLPAQIFFEVHPLGNIDPDPTFTKPLTNMLDLGYCPDLVISSSHVDAKKRFDELNYQPFKSTGVNASMHYLYNNIKASDLLKVAARRPKITRAILLKRAE